MTSVMYLRVSVTDRCNLRCKYCLPELARFRRTGATDAELHDLMTIICETAKVSKIRVTGGEPTLDPNLIDHVRVARTLVPTVGMTSNGTRLLPLLASLKEAGLTRLNISLDADSPEGFRAMARRDGYPEVLSAIREARRLEFSPLKVNCVAMNSTDPVAMARLAIAEGFHLRFIELMAIGVAAPTWEQDFIKATELRARLTAAGFVLSEQPELDEPTSRIYTLRGVDPERTTLGFITTVTAPFCSTCNRLRLTREGRLHYCLFDASGLDLLSVLRQQGRDATAERVRLVLDRKQPPPHFRRLAVMAAIGG